MSEAELKKRIEWIEWVLKDSNRLKLTADTIADQQVRKANLQALLNKITTCWCGKGQTLTETNRGGEHTFIRCGCNQRDFTISLTR